MLSLSIACQVIEIQPAGVEVCGGWRGRSMWHGVSRLPAPPPGWGAPDHTPSVGSAIRRAVPQRAFPTVDISVLAALRTPPYDSIGGRLKIGVDHSRTRLAPRATSALRCRLRKVSHGVASGAHLSSFANTRGGGVGERRRQSRSPRSRCDTRSRKESSTLLRA